MAKLKALAESANMTCRFEQGSKHVKVIFDGHLLGCLSCGPKASQGGHGVKPGENLLARARTYLRRKAAT